MCNLGYLQHAYSIEGLTPTGAADVAILYGTL